MQGVDEGPEADPLSADLLAGEDRQHTFGSIEADTSPIARAIDTTKPLCISIIRVPAPTPRLFGGTTPITALVLGELKMPEPAPTTSCQKASCQ